MCIRDSLDTSLSRIYYLDLVVLDSGHNATEIESEKVRDYLSAELPSRGDTADLNVTVIYSTAPDLLRNSTNLTNSTNVSALAASRRKATALVGAPHGRRLDWRQGFAEWPAAAALLAAG